MKLEWFTSYLSGRTQVVQGRKKSSAHSSQSGVPQGTILGPILFTVFTDLLTGKENGVDHHTECFAYDTVVHAAADTAKAATEN